MAGEWVSARVGDVADINPEALGSAWPFPYIRYIDISSVGEGVIQETPRMIELAEAPSRAKRLVRQGDTVLSSVRPNRRSMFFASRPSPDWIVSTGFTVLRPKREKVDPRYLYACVFDKRFTEYLVGREKGAAYPAVLPEDIADAPILLPPILEQRAIASILGTLDDKIELNRRMNETLEAMARAIFKSWFVDFDPIRAKTAGRNTGLPKHIAALFTDKFQDSSLGDIPKGWVTASFSDTVEILGGGTPKTSMPEYWNGDIPWFSVGDTPKPSDVFVIDTEKKITQEGLKKSATQILPKGTTIISARGTVGNLALVGIPMAMNQSCYGLRGNRGYGDCYTFFATASLIADLKQRTHGSVFDTITRDTFKTVRVVAPPVEIASKFEEATRPLLERILSNLQQSRTLASIQDVLLPKLISGEIRIRDAERIAGTTV